MEISIGSAVSKSKNKSSVTIAAVACVQISKFSTAQGVLVWEDGNLACVRAFSKQYVGRRIKAHSRCASPKGR
jgi:hypothetical protein